MPSTQSGAVASAVEKAKAKNARLRLMKERNENYLAERRDYDDDPNDELTKERLAELIREPHFVPGGTPLFTQLQRFQEQQDRVSLVVDEYGELMGLVTLENILEEIIGEFATHSPLKTGGYVKQPDGSYLVEGATLLRELNRKLGYRFPLDGPKTLNGLILEYLQDIPQPNTSVKIGDHPLDIVQTHDRVVKAVRLYPPTPQP